LTTGGSPNIARRTARRSRSTPIVRLEQGVPSYLDSIRDSADVWDRLADVGMGLSAVPEEDVHAHVNRARSETTAPCPPQPPGPPPSADRQDEDAPGAEAPSGPAFDGESFSLEAARARGDFPSCNECGKRLWDNHCPNCAMIAGGLNSTLRTMINAVVIPPLAGTKRGGTPAGDQNVGAGSDPVAAGGNAQQRGKVTIRGQRSELSAMLRYWWDLGPRFQETDREVQGRGPRSSGSGPHRRAMGGRRRVEGFCLHSYEPIGQPRDHRLVARG
jgi:hypothetical protein